MAETLYDENFGGRFGNFHLAVGMAYKESFTGKVAKVSQKEWENLGFNDSVVHTDIISTKDRKVVAILENGKEIELYKLGKFVI
jgi:aminopeptidase